MSGAVPPRPQQAFNSYTQAVQSPPSTATHKQYSHHLQQLHTSSTVTAFNSYTQAVQSPHACIFRRSAPSAWAVDHLADRRWRAAGWVFACSSAIRISECPSLSWSPSSSSFSQAIFLYVAFSPRALLFSFQGHRRHYLKFSCDVFPEWLRHFFYMLISHICAANTAGFCNSVQQCGRTLYSTRHIWEPERPARVANQCLC